MTPPAAVGLYLALACSIFGTASKTTADHEANDNIKAQSFLDIIDKNHVIFDEAKESYPLAMQKYRTNFNEHNVRDERFINYDVVHVNNELDVNKNVIMHAYKAIYTAAEERSKRTVNVKDRDVRGDVRQYNSSIEDSNKALKRSKRQDNETICENFLYDQGKKMISHPKGDDDTYAREVDCETIIYATDNNIISLDFVDMFHIEDHPTCEYDYLEIRDGKYGYSKLKQRYCGEKFPTNVKSTGQYLWLKFHSDKTIEYEGFHINIAFERSSGIKIIPPSCYIPPLTSKSGVVDTARIPTECITQSQTQELDVLWTIEIPEDNKIYLNFTEFNLKEPNECNENYVEVFVAKTDIPSRLEIFCGSMANSVNTKDTREGKGENIMYVHFYTSTRAEGKGFNATYTAFRTLDTDKNEQCNTEEFDCEDSTCIAKELKCDHYAHCRLKTDEDSERCKGKTESLLSQTHILLILVIFSLILSGIIFVFLFKCIRKLVQDHKIIKEHIRQSCEDRLDSLDVRKLPRDSQPRASLERENHTNEMYKKQRSLSHPKPSSIDSDFIQETHLDLDDEPWRRDVDSVRVETEDVRIEQNGRTRRSDLSRKQESIRRDRAKQNDADLRERKENRDVSVGVPDTKESGCQTRESLFQPGTGSSEGTDSGSGGRAFSTFGYSGATIARPSPPAPPVAASQITIELLKTCPSHDSKMKKLPERRPMSNETTRSAPDVIIVSKPIR